MAYETWGEDELLNLPGMFENIVNVAWDSGGDPNRIYDMARGKDPDREEAMRNPVLDSIPSFDENMSAFDMATDLMGMDPMGAGDFATQAALFDSMKPFDQDMMKTDIAAQNLFQVSPGVVTDDLLYSFGDAFGISTGDISGAYNTINDVVDREISLSDGNLAGASSPLTTGPFEDPYFTLGPGYEDPNAPQGQLNFPGAQDPMGIQAPMIDLEDVQRQYESGDLNRATARAMIEQWLKQGITDWTIQDPLFSAGDPDLILNQWTASPVKQKTTEKTLQTAAGVEDDVDDQILIADPQTGLSFTDIYGIPTPPGQGGPGVAADGAQPSISGDGPLDALAAYPQLEQYRTILSGQDPSYYQPGMAGLWDQRYSPIAGEFLLSAENPLIEESGQFARWLPSRLEQGAIPWDDMDSTWQALLALGVVTPQDEEHYDRLMAAAGPAGAALASGQGGPGTAVDLALARYYAGDQPHGGIISKYIEDAYEDMYGRWARRQRLQPGGEAPAGFLSYLNTIAPGRFG